MAEQNKRFGKLQKELASYKKGVRLAPIGDNDSYGTSEDDDPVEEEQEVEEVEELPRKRGRAKNPPSSLLGPSKRKRTATARKEAQERGEC
jgi:hypothetical protein